AVRLVIRRHVVFGRVGEQLQPIVELPVIEQIGLVIEQVFHLGAGHGRRRIERRVHAWAPSSTSELHLRQNTRRWPSSVASCSWLLPMPRERSVHGASR